MKRSLLLLLIVLPSIIYGQNILNNGSLEDPTAFDLDPKTKVSGYYFEDWLSAGESNPEFIYDTEEVSIEPVDGLGLVRFTAFDGPNPTNEQHLIGSFRGSMFPQVKYTIEFQIALDRTSSHASNPFVLYFTNDRGETLEDVDSYFVIDNGDPITNMRWRTVRFDYVAQGGEFYFHIQTKGGAAAQPLVDLKVESFQEAQNSSKRAHYFIDAISITPIGTISNLQPSKKALALLFDMRKQHAYSTHDLENLQARLEALEDVEQVSVLTLGTYAELHFRGPLESLDFGELRELIGRVEPNGDGDINEGIQEALYSIQEFKLLNQVAVISELDQSWEEQNDQEYRLMLWATSEPLSLKKIPKTANNAAFVPFNEALNKQKRNQYSFAIGAEYPSPNTIKYLRAETSKLVAEINFDDVISLSSERYGDIQRDVLTPGEMTSLFFSLNITKDEIVVPILRPLYSVMDEITQLKLSYRTDFHPDSLNQIVVGVTDGLVDFEAGEYPYRGEDLLSRIKAADSIPVYLAVLDANLGSFDYYYLDQETETWLPTSKSEIFPSNKEIDYHSFRYQNYINESVKSLN